MKYWRGFLVAGILSAISFALVQFAQSHQVLVDMIYPYVTRLMVTSMAGWTENMAFCLWQVIVFGLVAAGAVSVVLMFLLRWNPIQWLGWVLAVASCFGLLNTAVYGLNRCASPLADDVRLEITDYTITELNQATLYFRDKANALAPGFNRDKKGNPQFGSFEELAVAAGDGFRVLTYEDAISVFAGSTAPVKKLAFKGFYTMQGKSGDTFPLTGEAAVNPAVPSALMPFAMCKEMAHRMSIYSDTDGNYAAFLACISNPSQAFQYSGYLMAYRFCRDALAAIPTSTAQTCYKNAVSGEDALLKADLEDYTDFFGDTRVEVSRLRTTAVSKDTAKPEEGQSEIVFSEYESVTDMLASWYVQNFITPTLEEDTNQFDPLDKDQVDLTDPIAP